ncbi:MAG: hypothetical protein LBT93_06495 [Treponema sp.]|jgi:hypothetical protein|nr:hypothetical protein [Treponema sp.]
MESRIIPLIVNENPVLGFDTGLNPVSFAQAKLAQFITESGYRVKPEDAPGNSGTGDAEPGTGMIETWQAGGVIERDASSGTAGTMVIWGPAFEGDRLDRIVSDDKRKDEALSAVINWIRSRLVLEAREHPPYPWPAGALCGNEGEILFPPDRLIRRSIEAEGPGSWLNGAERWIHPDLKGSEATVFAAGALLYRIFCGEAPFSNEDIDVVREDMREGVFVPCRLMAPGLDTNLSTLIDRAIAPIPKGQGEKNRPTLDQFILFFESGGPKKRADYFQPLDPGELASLKAEKEQFQKKKKLTVNTRRFMVRNNIIILGILLGLLGAGLVTGSIIKSRAELPTTQGMEPEEVALSYYASFETLDHTMMEACVINRAGKSDIEMVTNFFVINRVRQAYEMTAPPILAAQEWVDGGGSPTTAFVFGVSDLIIETLKKTPEEILLRASYLLWMPAAYAPLEDSPPAEEPEELSGLIPEAAPPALPQGFAYTDELRLIPRKGAWRIAEINREVR